MSSKLLEYPAALCNQIRRIAIEAGELTLDYFDDAGCDHELKSDHSPVTLADKKAEALIAKALKDILPDIPMIGEEDVACGNQCDHTTSDYFWLVDPLDGTKEFISGSGEYTVNIALLKNPLAPSGRGVGGEGATPVLGIVYAPWFGDLYAGFGPGTAFKWHQDSGVEKPISVRPIPREGLTVVTSKSHSSGDKLSTYLEQFKINKLLKRGSSLKICAIAAGKADLYPRFGETCEWDTAAAHAVLSSAGGHLVDAESGHELTYGHNRNGKWLNPEFIASGFLLKDNI